MSGLPFICTCNLEHWRELCRTPREDDQTWRVCLPHQPWINTRKFQAQCSRCSCEGQLDTSRHLCYFVTNQPQQDYSISPKPPNRWQPQKGNTRLLGGNKHFSEEVRLEQVQRGVRQVCADVAHCAHTFYDLFPNNSTHWILSFFPVNNHCQDHEYMRTWVHLPGWESNSLAGLLLYAPHLFHGQPGSAAVKSSAAAEEQSCSLQHGHWPSGSWPCPSPMAHGQTGPR